MPKKPHTIELKIPIDEWNSLCNVAALKNKTQDGQADHVPEKMIIEALQDYLQKHNSTDWLPF